MIVDVPLVATAYICYCSGLYYWRHGQLFKFLEMKYAAQLIVEIDVIVVKKFCNKIYGTVDC